MMNEFNGFLEQLNNCIFNNESNIQSDVVEIEGGYEVLTDLPGVSKENIGISFENGNLIIELKKKEDDRERKYLLRERDNFFGKKTISFNEDVDFDNAKATFENGVLSIYLPKMPKKNTTIKID